jgi:hypothetical protein
MSLKETEQKGKTGPVSGFGSSGRWEDTRKRYRWVNVVEILCTHV